MAINPQLDALFTQARQAANRGDHSPEDIATLKAALKTFIRARPQPVGTSVDLPALLRICDQRIENTALSPEDKYFLIERGVRYAGELCYVIFHYRTRHSIPLVERGARIMTELGLLAGFYPLAHGWRPIYWDHEPFITALHMPNVQAFGSITTNDLTTYKAITQGIFSHSRSKTFARVLHQHGLHFLGDYLRFGRDGENPRGWNTLALVHRERELEQSPLWAAALVPPDWKASNTPPQAWLEEQACMLEEVDLYETPVAWVVEDAGRRRVVIDKVFKAVQPGDHLIFVLDGTNVRRPPEQFSLVIDGDPVTIGGTTYKAYSQYEVAERARLTQSRSS